MYVLVRWKDRVDNNKLTESIVLLSIDVTDPATPRHVHSLQLPSSPENEAASRLGYLTVGRESRAVKSGSSLVLTHSSRDWEGHDVGYVGSYEVVDLSDPHAPRHAGSLARPKAAALGSLRKTADGEVFSWRMDHVGEPGQVAYYLERVDLSGTEPKLLPVVNTPGAVVAYDPASRRALTADSRWERPDIDERSCLEHEHFLHWDRDRQMCLLVYIEPRLVEITDPAATWLGEVTLASEERMDRVVVAGNRVFARTRTRPIGDEGDGYTQDIAVIPGLENGEPAIASRLELRGLDLGLAGEGSSAPRLFVPAQGEVRVVDATDASAPVVRRHRLYGPEFREVYVRGQEAYLSLGGQGLQRIELD